jgi:hypothetical protein
MPVTAAPVSKSHEKVLVPALTISLGLIMSPLKGIMLSKSLLQVAIKIMQRLKLN